MHYIFKSIKKNIIPFEEEDLTATQKLNEYIMTSLRTMEGLDLKHIKNYLKKRGLKNYISFRKIN